MTALFGPQGANAVTVKPDATKQRYGGNQTWVKDCSAPGASDGTVLDAAFYNRLIGALDYLAGAANVSALPGDDSVLYRSILQIIAGSAPDALNTLKELADALGDDPNYAATVTRLLGNRLQFDQPQSLTPIQKAQAVLNLGLAVVAVTGNYGDLAGRPTLGTAAALDVGPGANKLVQLDSSGRYPALDGSQISNVNAAGSVSVTTSQSLTLLQQSQALKNIGMMQVWPNWLTGLELSTAGSSTSFGVASGAATNTGNTDVMVLSAALTKTTGAWAVGTGQGGLDAGAVSASTGYYVYLIYRPDTGVTDVCFSLSSSAPTFGSNIPAAYTKYRRIGWMKTNGSSQWTKFIQRGDYFLWDTPVLDLSAYVFSAGALSVLQTLTVPRIAGVRALTRVAFSHASVGAVVKVSSPEVSAVANTGDYQLISQVSNTVTAAQLETPVDGSGRVNTTLGAVASGGLLYINTYGWVDTRGK